MIQDKLQKNLELIMNCSYTFADTQRRHKTLYCIMGHHDQYRANGLAFMPVLNNGVVFSFSFLADTQIFKPRKSEQHKVVTK